jgi:uncharacterized membrane protein (UPF0127 family)
MRSFVIAASLLMAMSCASAAPPAKVAPEVLFSVGKSDLHVNVELCRDDAERQRGLMFRRSLDGGKGMLFIFPKPEQHKFWMRNTYISLDMIFLDADKNVVHVEERAEPLTDAPRGPDSLTQYVVEVPGGWAKTHGIEPGIKARFVGVPSQSQ